MFLNFFFALRKHGLPVSLHEYLALMDALKKQVIDYRAEDFYALSRAIFVKQEAHLDRFDMIFGQYFKGLDEIPDDFFETKIPKEWLEKFFLNHVRAKHSFHHKIFFSSMRFFSLIH